MSSVNRFSNLNSQEFKQDAQRPIQKKKHYLLVWPTIRKDWVHVFEQLKNEFVFTFLPSTFPHENNEAKDFDCIYWSEFTSVGEVLEKVRPDGLIFMSIESGLSMTINHLAQNRGIRTIILQHGIFTNYKDYRIREKLWRKSSRAKEIRSEHVVKGFRTLSFLYNSLTGIDKLKLFPISIYTKLQQKFGPYWVSKRMPLKIKKPDLYLCYSPFNATIHKETDRILDDKIKYIGSPELIQYLHKETDLVNEPFYLHIDQALAENSFGEETLDKQIMIEFYLKINKYCLRKGAKLYIKLHPESYNSTWLPNDSNIRYIRHTENFNRIVQSAIGCFGFYSTMIIPAIYWTPTILFKINYSGLQDVIKRLGMATFLDFWSFNEEDIHFENTGIDQEAIKNQFILPIGVENGALVTHLNEL